MASQAPHVFISYARPSEAHARRIAETLRAEGYTIWWDDDLPAHRAYGDVIEERLKASKAVLVLWSADAVRSQWVRAEADAARHCGTLVQLSIDGATPPMPFNQIQCPTLAGWSGDTSAPAWRKILSSIAELVEAGGAAIHREPVRHRRLSICVLPFSNVSGDPEQEYFSDGISEDLIIGLSRISALGVIARNTSFTFKGKPTEVTAVGSQLNVSHVLEGSVRKSGNRLRVTAQLIDAVTGEHLWAERYDRELTDIFEIQDSISEAIISELRLKLAAGEMPAEPRRLPHPQAYESYLRARHCWNRGTEAALHQAVALFNQAIEKDPLYARSYAGLADAFVLLGMHTYLDPGLAYRHARTAAQRALELEPELADAHASLGLIAFVHDWDAQAAEQHLNRAVELDPASATARHHYARLLSARGRHEEAIAQARAAAELEPLSVAAAVQLATALNLSGNSKDGIAQLEKTREIYPDEFRVHYNLSFALASAGREEEALVAAQEAVRIGGLTMFSLGVLGFAQARAGLADEARAILAKMEAAAAERYVCPFDIAVIHAALDQRDAAFRWLAQALKMRDHAMLFAEVDPALASLREDPRFDTIVAQIWAR